MIILRALYWISGYVSIRVTGQWLERFLNLMISHHIAIWDIRRTGGMLTAKVTLSGFRKLRPIARKSRVRIHLEGRAGLPFFASRLERRMLLVVGAACFVLLLYLLTSTVWIVKVTGTVALNPDNILGIARKYGLKPGAFKRSLNLRDIERNIVLETGGLSWAKIRAQGTLYTIEVIEKAQKPQDLEAVGPCNVVALKDGTIVSMLVLMGKAEVKEGDRVSRGQTLVSGALYLTLPDNSRGVPAKFLHARAIVKAKVVYEAYHEVPLTKTTLVRTGKTQKGIGIRIGKVQVVWRSPFTNFEYCEITPEPVAEWISRNTESFVELHKVTYHELKPENRTIGSAEARLLAEKAAQDSARALVPPGAEVASVKVTENAGNDSVGVTVKIDVIEEIGVPQPINSITVEPPAKPVKR